MIVLLLEDTGELSLLLLSVRVGVEITVLFLDEIERGGR